MKKESLPTPALNRRTFLQKLAWVGVAALLHALDIPLASADQNTSDFLARKQAQDLVNALSVFRADILDKSLENLPTVADNVFNNFWEKHRSPLGEAIDYVNWNDLPVSNQQNIGRVYVLVHYRDGLNTDRIIFTVTPPANLSASIKDRYQNPRYLTLEEQQRRVAAIFTGGWNLREDPNRVNLQLPAHTIASDSGNTLKVSNYGGIRLTLNTLPPK